MWFIIFGHNCLSWFLKGDCGRVVKDKCLTLRMVIIIQSWKDPAKHLYAVVEYCDVYTCSSSTPGWPFYFLFFVIIGRVKRITQPVFVTNKRECRELVNLKRAFPPLKRSISYAPSHRLPQTSFKFCQIL